MQSPIFSIPVHSFVDLITNSSSEVFVTSDRQTITSVKKLINCILATSGSTKSCDDLLTIKLVNEDGGYGNYNTIQAFAKDPSNEELAKLVSSLPDFFRAEEISSE